MYLGIDLGTSNSAIAGETGSDFRLYKTTEGTDVLPSVIYIDRRGHRFVGVRAYEQAFRSPENVAQGFKRLMGTKTPIEFSASGVVMTPEEASAEIIRTLFAQAVTETGKSEVTGAVVTIPAAFNQMQSEATLRAANSAGLEQVGLLQEPIAAAMAAMAHSQNKNGQFLVYDLGGGTFDLALVQSLSGSVNILAHEGINMLGGRDFDKTILNSMIRPWLLDNFDLPQNFQTDRKFQRLIRMAQWAAERAKVELSTKETSVIFAGDEDIRVSDGSGKEIYLEVSINRNQLEDLIGERIDETIDLSREMLKRNGYTHEDIDRVVFIGGPSKMPLIRQRVPQELGIPGDLQTDPMTAVATGAAVFAESREWTGGATKRKSARASHKSEGSIEIKYDYATRTADDRTRIKIQPPERIYSKGFEMQIDSQDGWTSGRIEINGEHRLEIPLSAAGENAFRVTVFDERGAPVSDAGTVLLITRTRAAATGIPATQTISVKVVEGTKDVARNVLDPVVEKGTLLPAQGRKTFKAARDLRAGDEAHIDMELYQQAPGVPEPELNLFIGAFRISGSHIPAGMAIRKGDEVTVLWKMDDNGLLSCKIEVPSVGQIFDTDRFYSDAAGHQNFEGDDGDQLARAVIDAAQEDIASTDEILNDVASGELEALKSRLANQQDALQHAHDADSRRSISEDARHIRQTVSRLKHAPENRGKVLRQQLQDLIDKYDEFARDQAEPRTNDRFAQLAETVRAGISRGDSAGLEEATRALDEMHSLYAKELFQQPAYLIFMFKGLSEERYLATDKEKFDILVERGALAITNGNIDELRRVIGGIYENRFTVGAQDQSLATLAGLMRA